MVALAIRSTVDPGDLGVNIRFKTNVVMHPRARAAQDALVVELKERLRLVSVLPDPTRVELYFRFRSNAFDIDGPIKRAIDALQLAAQTLEFDWNDNRVAELFVRKTVNRGNPGLSIIVMEVEEGVQIY